MAPGALIDPPSVPSAKKADAPRHIFPDGIRTSGQHPPLYDRLRPYADFPREIAGPTLWHKETYEHHPERWTHRLTDAEIHELGAATDAYLASGAPLEGITKADFPLPALSEPLAVLRETLLNGRGFLLLKGFPAREWGPRKTAAAYLGLGTHVGRAVSQNSRGHVLGHVKDVGDDAAQIDEVRIYRTAARQFFHSDDGDVVGLLCVHRAAEGGESDVVSAHAVWNDLQRRRPDVAELLTRPVWFFDRKGETSAGQEGFVRQPVFYLEDCQDSPRVYSKWDPYYVLSLARFSDQGVVPPLSDAQREAMDVLEETCQRLALHMVLEVGDVQFVSNTHLFHARTAYRDYPAPAPRRHLLRLWLSTPQGEGGWALPFHDSFEAKRGGIQVDDTPPRAPLDAE